MIDSLLDYSKAVTTRLISTNSKYVRLRDQFDTMLNEALTQALAEDAITDQAELEAAVAIRTSELQTQLEEILIEETNEDETEANTVFELEEQLVANGIDLSEVITPVEPELEEQDVDETEEPIEPIEPVDPVVEEAPTEPTDEGETSEPEAPTA